MAEPSSSRKRSNNEGFLGVANKKNPKSKHEENKFMSRVLLPNRLNLTLELEDASEDMSVAKFADIEITEKGSRKIHGGSQVFVEDAMGERIEEGNIICQASRNKPMIIALQVACRDFPHPRQFCVMFPFNSTPHEKHCALCHCYVCDKLAPFFLWGKGNASSDHCHSSDKEERWTKLRNCHKMHKDPSLVLPPSSIAILSLTTLGSSVLVGRSNQAGTGAVLPVPSNLNTYARQPSLSTRPGHCRSLSSRNNGNRTASIEISSSCYRNYVSSQNRKFDQIGSRFGSSVQRNASNLGVHRQGTLIQRSSRSRLTSVDSLQCQRDSINLLLSSNMRQNTADTSATAHTYAMNTHIWLIR